MNWRYVLAVLILASSPLASAQQPRGTLLATTQLNEWCMSQDAMKQQFCQAYLFGVYEVTDCKFKIETPSFEELRTTFVTWVFVKKDDAFIYAFESALAAYRQKYGCGIQA